MSDKPHQLLAISPIDGRYRSKIEPLADYFSEFALIKYRVKIEVLYLIELVKIKIVRPLKSKEIKLLNDLWQDFSLESAAEIKRIEKEINHDVKAVEYFIKDKLKNTSVVDLTPFVHFALTSEDINNLAYSLMVTDFIKNLYYPSLATLINKIKILVKKNQAVVMLARTHGQPASPTTLGKELSVFIYRLQKQKETFPKKMAGKLAGAVGNFNAHHIAYPGINWLKFEKDFINKLGLEPWLVVTQIEPHDRLAELFDALARINNILLDFVKDIWLYISFDYLKQKALENEIGSSTMPHKVNPIDFENAEGSLGVANALLAHFSEKLPISRLQRDLSDSTVERCMGVAFGHTILSFNSIIKGLSKISANEAGIKHDLNDHPELIAEAIQTILRREKINNSYEILKEITRGKIITLESLHKFIDNLKIPVKVKKEIKKLKVENYIGLAKKLTRLGIK